MNNKAIFFLAKDKNIGIKTNAPDRSIVLHCDCGRELYIHSDDEGDTWEINIVGTWFFKCPCGNKFKLNPRTIKEQKMVTRAKVKNSNQK